jgi:hypothetical protein
MSEYTADTAFDDDLSTVEGMQWLPWIGDKYSSGARVLVLGESHYNWGEDDEGRRCAEARLDNRLFNRELITVDHGMNRQSHQKFYRNIERMLFQVSYPRATETDFFWRNAAYFNLVQRPMPDHRTRPTDDDLANGWDVCLRILRIIRPGLILVAGSDWRKVNTFKDSLTRSNGSVVTEICSEAISNAYGKHLVAATSDEAAITIVFSMHPSSRNYSWKKWHPFVFECAPQLSEFVQQCRCYSAA